MFNNHKRDIITKELLYHLFEYNKSAGLLIWKNAPKHNSQLTGLRAGTIVLGYRSIKIKGLQFKEHHLIWFIETGAFPKYELDHINGLRDDNRYENLRDISKELNQQNQRSARVDNKTGFLGVSKKNGKFYAQISSKRLDKKFSLGYFDTAEEAHLVYLEKKREIHEGCTI